MVGGEVSTVGEVVVEVKTELAIEFLLGARFPKEAANSAHAWESSQLFVAQRDHRFDAHGAARGDVAGGECNSHQQSRHCHEGNRVGGRHAVQQAGHQPR
jgi:hypothetical protein